MQPQLNILDKSWKNVVLFMLMLFCLPPAKGQLYSTGAALYNVSTAIPALDLKLASTSRPKSHVENVLNFQDDVRFSVLNSYFFLSFSLPENMPLRARMFWGEKGLFRLIGLGPDSRREELKLRRRMLQWHQRFGLATWASFTAQMIVGQKLLGGSDLAKAHGVLAATTVLGYMTTASFSLFSPPARTYKTQAKSILTHRVLALVHFAGMVAIPILGEQLTHGDGSNYQNLKNAHQTVAWVTYGAYSAALLTSYLTY